MIIWAVVTGALIGALAMGGPGFLLGGFFGAFLGLWLRSLVRGEISRAMHAAQLGTPMPHVPVDIAQPAAPMPFAAAPPPVQEAEPAAAPQPELAPPAASEQPTPPPPQAHEPRPAPPPREPNWAEQAFANARGWLLGGNTIVRVGLVILFVGLVFLANLAAAAGLFPIEARLSVIALAGIALLVVGLRKRLERPPFAMALQGTGVAVLYLTVFAAAKAYQVLPAGAAFAFMILFAVLGVALALMQDSLTMALTSFLGGFAVPVLLGGHSETPLPLFSYLTILNLAILFIAWKKSWRPLNLLGFAATFLLATLWGFTTYQDRHFAICEAFLILSIAIYLATAVLYAHNTPGKFGNFADSTLLFGTALAGFGLQAGLVHDRPFASAWSSLGFGAAYLALTAFTLRRKQPEMRLLGECMLAIGVGFVTLAIPLALEAKWTSSAWALEGAGAFWVGARQARWMPRLFGLLLQALAAFIAISLIGPNVSAVPLANNGFLLPLLVALPMLFTARLMRNVLEHSGLAWAKGYAPLERGLSQPWFIFGFLFVVLAIGQEVSRKLPANTANGWPTPVLEWHMQVLAGMLAVLAAMVLAAWFGRRRKWSVATWPARLSLPVMILCFLTVLVDGRHVLYRPDALFWVLALALHLWLLRRQRTDGWTSAMHTGVVLLVTVMAADSLAYGVDQAELWHTSWAGVVFLVSATLMLLAITRWAGKAAPLESPKGLGWPRDPFARAYWKHAGVVLAVLVYIGAMLTALLAEGVTDPLPYIPLLNPIDLSVLLALAVFALWRRMALSAPRSARSGPQTDIPPGTFGLVAEAVLAFALVNTVWLRTAHHFLRLQWDAQVLASSQVVQAGYSILWTLVAMGLMIWSRRRGQRLPWLTGAVLLGVVVVKLVAIDMSKAESIARIVAFIGVGVMMLLIGYFVPLPPRKKQQEEAPT